MYSHKEYFFLYYLHDLDDSAREKMEIRRVFEVTQVEEHVHAVETDIDTFIIVSIDDLEKSLEDWALDNFLYKVVVFGCYCLRYQSIDISYFHQSLFRIFGLKQNPAFLFDKIVDLFNLFLFGELTTPEHNSLNYL